MNRRVTVGGYLGRRRSGDGGDAVAAGAEQEPDAVEMNDVRLHRAVENILWRGKTWGILQCCTAVFLLEILGLLTVRIVFTVTGLSYVVTP